MPASSLHEKRCFCTQKWVIIIMTILSNGWRFGVVVSALVSINKVNLRRARLVLRWVTVSGVQSPVPENLSQYITSHPGQLSLVIPPWIGVMSTSQRAVMPFGLRVKAGIVRKWVAGKTVWSPCYHGPWASLAMGSSHNKPLYKCPITSLYFTVPSGPKSQLGWLNLLHLPTLPPPVTVVCRPAKNFVQNYHTINNKTPTNFLLFYRRNYYQDVSFSWPGLYQ